MKVIIYHYVRKYEKKSKYFRFLEFNNFKKQLDYFASNFFFINYNQLQQIIKKKIKPPKNSILLTFDDGIIDHYKYVYKELMRRKIFGIFFVSTEPLEKKIFLDVHKIHILIGKVKSKVLIDQLKNLILPSMIEKSKIKEFEYKTYATQSETDETVYFKRILNYLLKQKYKKNIINKLLALNKIDLKVKNFYLSIKHIKEMKKNGMLIGSHTFSHQVLSRLSPKDQSKEIVKSLKYLYKKIGATGIKIFSFPYGEKYTYNNSTLRILKKNKINASFTAYSKNISNTGYLINNLEIPRYDCNEFPFGKLNKTKY